MRGMREARGGRVDFKSQVVASQSLELYRFGFSPICCYTIPYREIMRQPQCFLISIATAALEPALSTITLHSKTYCLRWRGMWNEMHTKRLGDCVLHKWSSLYAGCTHAFNYSSSGGFFLFRLSRGLPEHSFGDLEIGVWEMFERPGWRNWLHREAFMTFWRF